MSKFQKIILCCSIAVLLIFILFIIYLGGYASAIYDVEQNRLQMQEKIDKELALKESIREEVQKQLNGYKLIEQVSER